jgi:hypothetical protein
MNRGLFFFFRHFLLQLLVCGISVQASTQDNLNLNAQIGSVDSAGIFFSADYYTWCSSVIKGEDGKYHMFYSRWPHGKRKADDDSMNHIFDGFRGWLKYSEIAYAVSDKLNGPYRYVKTILKGDGDTSRWDRYTMHNPQIRKFGKDYYLYYISNSFNANFPFKDSSKRREWHHWLKYNCSQSIGVIRAKSIKELVAGNYYKPDQPIMTVDNVHTFEVATNPTVAQGPDGKYYMMFKSRKPNVGNMTFWMAKADRPDQPFSFVGEVFTSEEMACEDPCMWYDKKRKRFYAAVKYYSNSKKLAPQFGALALITSSDGLHWQAATNSLISLREMKMTDGRKIELANLERPFVFTDKKGQPLAIFAAASLREPSKGDLKQVTKEYNTFNVCFPLGSQKVK